jgi:hypothetical protein
MLFRYYDSAVWTIAGLLLAGLLAMPAAASRYGKTAPADQQVHARLMEPHGANE